MIKKLLPLLLSLALVSCGPRGESKSLDEVLQIARERYTQVADKASASPANELLTALNKDLESLLESSQDRSATFGRVGDGLYKVFPKAGAPSRPAIVELAKQYKMLSHEKNVNDSTVKLVASRTYSMLASELETTGFKL